MKTLLKLALLLLPMTLLAQAPQIPLTGNIGSGFNGPLINSPAVVFATDADHTMVYPEMSGSGGTIIVTSTPSLTATRNLIAPNTGIFNWVVRNNTTGGQSINVKVAGGTGVSIANGDSSVVMCDTVNCYVPGGQNVTQFLAPTASWPSWLVPTVTNQYTTPSLAVTAAYTPLSAVTGTAPVDCTTTGSTVNCLMAQATSSVDGYLSHLDWATFNRNLSSDLAMQVVPPIAGQYVVIYPTAYTAGCLFGDCAAGTYGTPIANNTSAFLKTTGSAFAAGQTVTWSGFSLPSYVVPANVTAIYATATSSFSGVEEFVDFEAVLAGSGNISLLPSGPIHPSTVFFSSDPTKVATAVITGDIYGQSSGGCCNKGQLNIANVALIVYYTGTPPPATTAIQVVPPAYYNPSINTLGVDPNAPFPGLDLQPETVATLPAAGVPPVGTIYSVTDGTSATDCTTGGGTTTVLCQTNGTVWSAFSLSSSGITQLTGDVTTPPGSGSQVATLATVNSASGICGDATHVCQVTTNEKGLTTAQTTVAISGSGVSQIIAGTNVTISPTGGTGAVTINATAGSSGVQYNPTNTLYVFTGDSMLGDDTGVLGPLITVTGGSCNGTVCTITNSGTNGLAAGDWIYQGMTGFPTPPAPFGSVSTTYGIFQVLSAGLSSTQFEFNYTYATATITGGTVRLANYLVAQQVMQQPFFKGHGSFQIVTDANAYVANIDIDYTGLFHSISPAVTGNNPEYLIINDIFNNDLQGCATAATIKGHLQSIWAKAHTDGWIVVQGTATMAPWNSSGCAPYANAYAVNNWLYSQGKNATNTTGLYAGEFWDTLADVGAVLSNPIDTTLIATNGGMAPGGVQPYAQILNEAMGLQASATKAKSYVYYGASAVGGNTRGEVHTPLADSYHAFVVTDAAQDAEDLRIDTILHAANVNTLNYGGSLNGSNQDGYGVTNTDYMGNLNTGRPQCHVMGVGNAAYNHAYTCFNYVGSGSASNNLVIGLHGDNNYLSEWPSDANNFIYYPDGSFMPPGGVLGPATAPSGSCTRLGAFISSQDGQITYCPASGTWTTYTPTIGTWGALNYPTWTSGTPFVKMTAAGTFALDTNSYLTSLSGALLATGATTGATSQAQTFTDGVTLSNLSSYSGDLPSIGSAGLIQDSGIAASNVPLLNAANTFTATNTFNNATYSALFTGGKVGIGTTGPTGLLTVNKDASGTTLATLTDAHMVLENNSSQTKLVFSFGGVAKAGIRGDSSGNFNWFATGSQGHQFYSTIDTAGPILGMSASGLEIGGAAAATSAAKLSVNGNAAIGYAVSQTAPANGLIVSGNVSIGDTTATSMFNVGTANQFQVSSAGIVTMPVYAIASLPSAATSGAGAQVVVSDSLTYTPGACTNGGSDTMIAVSNGTTWSCH